MVERPPTDAELRAHANRRRREVTILLDEPNRSYKAPAPRQQQPAAPAPTPSKKAEPTTKPSKGKNLDNPKRKNYHRDGSLVVLSNRTAGPPGEPYQPWRWTPRSRAKHLMDVQQYRNAQSFTAYRVELVLASTYNEQQQTGRLRPEDNAAYITLNNLLDLAAFPRDSKNRHYSKHVTETRQAVRFLEETGIKGMASAVEIPCIVSVRGREPEKANKKNWRALWFTIDAAILSAGGWFKYPDDINQRIAAEVKKLAEGNEHPEIKRKRSRKSLLLPCMSLLYRYQKLLNDDPAQKVEPDVKIALNVFELADMSGRPELRRNHRLKTAQKHAALVATIARETNIATSGWPSLQNPKEYVFKFNRELQLVWSGRREITYEPELPGMAATDKVRT